MQRLFYAGLLVIALMFGQPYASLILYRMAGTGTADYRHADGRTERSISGPGAPITVWQADGVQYWAPRSAPPEAAAIRPGPVRALWRCRGHRGVRAPFAPAYEPPPASVGAIHAGTLPARERAAVDRACDLIFRKRCSGSTLNFSSRLRRPRRWSEDDSLHITIRCHHP